LFLLLGHKTDALCNDLGTALEAAGHSVRFLEDIFGSSAKVAWRLDSQGSTSACVLENGASLSDQDIHGLFVKKPLFQPPSNSSLRDAVYIYAEKEAALLGWISSLPGQVINRYTPALWFGPTESLDFWRERLERFGLEPADSMLTGPRAGGRSQTEQISESVCEVEVTARESVGRAYLVAVVGSRVIWEQGTPERLATINEALIEVARSVGLTYIEGKVLDSTDNPRILKLECFPKYNGFCQSDRKAIVNELVSILTTSGHPAPERTESDSWF
jgi:hypothetical protein